MRAVRQEQRWVRSTNAWELFRLLTLWVHPPDRKYRLFGAALCRHFWADLPEAARRAVEACERACDGGCSEEDRARAAEGADDAYMAAQLRRGRGTLDGSPGLDERVFRVAFALAAWDRHRGLSAASEALGLVAAYSANLPAVAILRDLFGNPFRSVAADASWLTSTVTALASQMYDSRDFGPMPILADALQDAGCVNDDVLDHCRDASQVHHRGCWVVDQLLGLG